MRKPVRRPTSDAQSLGMLHATLPRLLAARQALATDGHQVSGVVLPESMRPLGWQDGADVMGLPVTWGGGPGLLVLVD